MKNSLALFFILLWGIGHSQQWETVSPAAFQKVMEDCGKQYRKENYSVEFSRVIYMHVTDAVPASASPGKFIRGKGKEYRVESENQLVIQNKDLKMVIDSAEKLIVLMEPDSLFDDFNPQQMFAGQDLRSCQFSHFKKGNIDQYRIDFKPETSAYQFIEFSLDGAKKTLTRVEFRMVASNYMSTDFEDTSLEEPVMIMEYKTAEQLKEANNHFDLSSWLKHTGNVYELLPDLDFTLDDLRIQE